MINEKRNEYVNLLSHNVCQVTFTKLNGEIRVMPCTLKEDLLPTRTTASAEAKKQKEDVLSVFCTDKKEWRSFRVDNVTNIEVIS